MSGDLVFNQNGYINKIYTHTPEFFFFMTKTFSEVTHLSSLTYQSPFVVNLP